MALIVFHPLDGPGAGLPREMEFMAECDRGRWQAKSGEAPAIDSYLLGHHNRS